MYGPAKIMTLRDMENTRFSVWASKTLMPAIANKWEEKDTNGGTLFLRPLGKKSSSSSKFSYYDFKFKLVKNAE